MNDSEPSTPQYRDISFQRVSRNIDRADYCAESKTMRVLFHGGRAYEYQNVGPFLIECMSGAPSAGGYFSMAIKPYPKLYPCRRIDAANMVVQTSK